MPYRDAPRFGLQVITPPTAEPVQLFEAMEHLNIGFDERQHDGWLNRNIPAARQSCEGWLGRTLAPQTLELSFGGYAQSTTVPTYWQPLMLNPWPDASSVIELPMGPVTAVESIVYRDAAGDLTTLDAEAYVLDAGVDVPTLELASGGTWPTLQARRDAVKIRYVAGYTFPDDTPSPYPLPEALRAAMLLMLGHLFLHREASATQQAAELPLGAKYFMEPYRLRMGMA